MSQSLLIALLAGLGGMLGWGFADFFAKKTIDSIGDVASLAWAGVFGTIGFLIVAGVELARGNTLTFPHDLATWAILSFFGVLQAAVYLFVYRAFSKGQVSLLNPVFASFSGIVSLVSILFLGEMVGPLKLLILAILFIGVMLLNIDVTALRSARIMFVQIPGFTEIVIATALAAIWTIGWDIFVNGKDWLPATSIMFFAMTVTAFVAAMIGRTPLAVGSKRLWIFLALVGLSETLAFAAISIGYSMTSLTSIVALVSGGFSLPTVILARIYLHEKTTSIQSLGIGTIILGVLLLPLV